jgi:hypothetical protein
MSIRPLIACSVVIAALALAEGASAQNRPAAPAAASNAPAPVVAEQADRHCQLNGPRAPFAAPLG